jgi:hypothetical protein
MKILRLAVVAAAVAALQGAAAEAGGARQKLPHVARVAEARPEAALKRLSALEAGPTATAALGPGLRVVPVICRPSGVQPVCAETVRIDGSAGEWRPAHKVPGCVEGSVAAWGPLAVLAAPVARTAPAYRAAASTRTASMQVGDIACPAAAWQQQSVHVNYLPASNAA